MFPALVCLFCGSCWPQDGPRPIFSLEVGCALESGTRLPVPLGNTHSPVCDAAKLVLKSKALKALVFIAAVTVCLFYFGNVRRTCVFFGCRHLIAHIFKWILFWGCVDGRELQRRFGNPCASFRVRVRSLQCLFWNVAFVKKFYLELHRQCCFYFFGGGPPASFCSLAIRICVLGNWSVEDADFCRHRCR